jgi:hypothetical protein
MLLEISLLWKELEEEMSGLRVAAQDESSHPLSFVFGANLLKFTLQLSFPAFNPVSPLPFALPTLMLLATSATFGITGLLHIDQAKACQVHVHGQAHGSDDHICQAGPVSILRRHYSIGMILIFLPSEVI